MSTPTESSYPEVPKSQHLSMKITLALDKHIRSFLRADPQITLLARYQIPRQPRNPDLSPMKLEHPLLAGKHLTTYRAIRADAIVRHKQ